MIRAHVYCYNVRPNKRQAARAAAQGVACHFYAVLQDMADAMVEQAKNTGRQK